MPEEGIVLGTWLAGDEVWMGTSSEQLLEIFAGPAERSSTLGLGGWRVLCERPVVYLEDHPADRDVGSAVRAALEVEGFVLR
jgi:hypothetical protein